MTTDPDPMPPTSGSNWELRARRGGEVVHAVDGVLHLQGEKEWVLSGDAGVLDAVHAALPGHSELLGPGTLLLAFGNSVGRLDLPHLGRVEVASGKWGEEAFDQMLSDLVKVAGSLPFSFGVGPLLPLESSAVERERVRYHAFLYLQHVLSDTAPREDRLLSALEAILRDPHRRWRRVSRSVRLEEADRIDSGALAHLASGRLHRVDRAGSGTRLHGRGVRRLADRLGGHLPERIRESRVESDLDTVENRFVLHFLREARALAREMAAIARNKKGAFAVRLERDADMCARKLDRVLQASLWKEVSEPRHLSLTSTVLQGRRGYREVFRHWLRLRQGAHLPLAPTDSRRLVEAKDVALLYELWCYFRVVDHLQIFLGPPSGAGQVEVGDLKLDVRPEHRVSWPSITLDYNGCFSRGRRGARHAYSTLLCPDIVLTDRRREDVVVHLLDAKFRVDTRPKSAGRGTFKRADLAKMHAYRDAITAARSAWILYPGEDFQVFHLDPDEKWVGGVGAIPMAPRGTDGPVKMVLRELLGV